MLGPVVMSAAGDAFIEGARILTIIWESSTSAGNTCILRARGSNALLWKGRADSDHTYQGANFGPHGIPAPGGFVLAKIDGTGTLMVYLRED